MSKVYIATSGFSYSSWKNSFYPEGLASSQWLSYYSTRFNTLEINSSFYRFPTVKGLKKMADSTPEDFLFSIKAQKIITHTRRMKNAKEKVLEFLKIVKEGLFEKLGCVLFQLPPSYKFSDENLNNILESVPSSSHHVIEFRHASWWDNEAVIQAFKKHTLTFCCVSFPGLPHDFYTTGKVFYLRMHGEPELFKSSYTQEELIQVVKKIPKRISEFFIYFNNTTFQAGFLNALSLKTLMEKQQHFLV